MRLAKLASQKNRKNYQLKYEVPQQQSLEWGMTKNQTGGEVGKRFSGTLSILSSGSARSVAAGVNSVQRNSFGNGSCISSSASANNTCTKKKRKAKAKKFFNSTVFRCCLPCRGGSGSAAPATSPPLSPVPPNNSNSEIADTVTRKYSGKLAIELTTDGNESLIAAVKKHSLAETVATSATTPISLKTLINDEDDDDEEDLQQHVSAADIAAAKLAAGILPRKAEPETLSDTSVSPTTAALQLAATSSSTCSLLSTTNSLLSSTVPSLQTIFVANRSTTTQISHITPPNTNRNFANHSSFVEQSSIVPTAAYTIAAITQPPFLPLSALITGATAASATTTTSSSTASSTTSRSCCPPPQTSPLPHIKEEEESEQSLQRLHSISQDDENLIEPTSERQIINQQQQSQFDQLSPFTANPSGSSDSCTSLSATAVTTATTSSSITGGGCTPQEHASTSTPSPRIKHKFRKQHKSGWSRLILAPNSSLVPVGSSSGVANSSETLASSSNNSNSAATLAATQTRLSSSSATALATQQSASSQLLQANKMQAEQGSIGDLQKYHSRYLKNRRHTLANVR